jgi:hypothetical protein
MTGHGNIIFRVDHEGRGARHRQREKQREGEVSTQRETKRQRDRLT